MWSRNALAALLVMIISLFAGACGGNSRLPAVIPAPGETTQPSSTPAGQIRQPVSAFQSPLPKPTAEKQAVATPSTGKATITGRLIHYITGQPMASQNLSLPAIVCPPGVAEAEKRQQCVYVIDEAFDPSTLSDNAGFFVFQDVPAGEYILMIGNRTTKYTILTNDFNEPLIWKAEDGKVLELGDLVVDLR